MDEQSLVAATDLAGRLSLLPAYAVRTAVTLGLPERLIEWSSVERLSADRGTDPIATRLLIDYLTTLGLLERAAGGQVRLTTLGQVLLRSHPSDLARHWDMESPAYLMERAFARMPEALRSGDPAYPTEHGQDLYTDIEQNSEFVEQALESAGPLVDHSATSLAKWLDIPAGSTVVDLGAGAGIHLQRILEQSPTSTGIALDLPATVARAAELTPSLLRRERIRWVAGDIFSTQLPSGDLYLVNNVIVDLDDRRALRLLERIRRTVPTGAQLVVTEMARDRAEEGFAAYFSLHQFCMTGGRLRSASELSELATQAGFTPDGDVHFGAGISAFRYRPAFPRVLTGTNAEAAAPS